METNFHPDWLKRLKMGDKKTFEELIGRTQDMVYGIVYGHTQDASVTEDLAQDTYLKAFVSLNGLKDPQKIRSWLSSIAHHTAIDWVRKKKEVAVEENSILNSAASPVRDSRYRRQTYQFDRKLTKPGISNGAGESKEEQQDIASQIFKGLKPDDREIMILRYVEELSYKEIANTLNMTVSAVGEKLCRLRQNLEERFKSKKEDLL